MARSVRLLAASAVVTAALLTGCTSGHPGQGVGGPTTTGPHSSAQQLYPSATTGTTPDTTQTASLLAGLRAVDPALTSDSQQAVRAAVLVCAQLRDGGEARTLVPAAFSPVRLSSQQVAAVTTAVESSFCPVG